MLIICFLLNEFPNLWQEFATHIQDNLKPHQNRIVQVEVLHGTYNFQEWMAPMNLNIAGLTITEHDKAVNHSFRLIQRRDLERYSKDWTVAQDIREGQSGEQGRDVILLMKQYMSSSHLSQPPTLLLPAARASRLQSPAPKTLVSRNKIDAKTLKKYMKTAEVVGFAPWNMTVARDYLSGFCHRNESGMVLSGWLEPLHFLGSASARLSQQERSNALGEEPASAEWHDFAPVGPKPVKVTLRPVAAQPVAAPSGLSRVRLMDDDEDDTTTPAVKLEPKVGATAAPSVPVPKVKVEPKAAAAPSVPGPKVKVEPKAAAAPSVPGPKVKVEPKAAAAPSVPGPKVKVEKKANAAPSVPGPKVKVEKKATAAPSVPGPKVKADAKVKLEMKAHLPSNLVELAAALQGCTTKDQIRDYFTKSAYDERHLKVLLAYAENSDLFPSFLKYNVETHKLSNLQWSFGTDDGLEDMVDFMAYMIVKIKTKPQNDLMLPPPPPEERFRPMKRPASPSAGSAKAKAKSVQPTPKGKSIAKAKAKHVSQYRWPANRNGLGCPKCKGRWNGCAQCIGFKAQGKPWPEDHAPRGFQFENDDIE